MAAPFPGRGQQAPQYWDTQLKAYIDEAATLPDRLSEEALSATLVARPPTVDEMLAAHDFLVMGHRGGGKLVWPDGSLEGMIDAAQLGAHGVEPDLRRLLGGGLGVMHDTTVDRTTSTTGNTEDFTLQSWRSLTLDPSAWSFPMPGWGNLKPPTWGDVVAQVGPLGSLLIPEVRVAGQAEDDAREVIRTSKAAGIEKSLIISSFVWDACLVAVSEGVDAMWADNDGTSRPPSDLVNAGIRFLACDSAVVSDATVAAFTAVGIHVIVWTLDRQSDVALWKAKGARGCYSDSPLYASGNVKAYRVKRAPWTKNPRFYHGNMPYSFSTGYDPHKPVGSDYLLQPDTSGSYLAGAFCPVADPLNYDITVPMRLATSGATDTQWTGFYINVSTDANAVSDTVDGILCATRQNGQTFLARRNPGTGSFSVLGTLTGTALTSGTSHSLRLVRAGDSLTLTRPGTAGSITGSAGTANGGYLFLRDSGQNSGGRAGQFGAIAFA